MNLDNRRSSNGDHAFQSGIGRRYGYEEYVEF